MKVKRYLARITLLMMLSLFVFSFTYALADDTPAPNFEQGDIQYYLSAPNTLTIELGLLGTHEIILEDDAETTLQWDYNVPAETIGYYGESISYMSMEFSRNVYIVVTNELIINYSRAAYESGQQFLTGELTQHIIAYETLAATFPIPTEYTFDQVEVVVSQLSAGNFESIEEGSMQVSFPVTSRQIVNNLSNSPVPSYLAENYRYIEIVSEHLQNINLPPDFVAMIIEQIENIPTELPTELPTKLPEELPQVTPMVTIEPVMGIAASETIEQAEDIIEETIPDPSTVEVVASAVSVAIAVGAAGSIASAASGGASVAGAASASAGLQQVSQIAATAATAGSGNFVISFLKDVITGLRDMFMDESRAHASGKMRKNLKKLGKK